MADKKFSQFTAPGSLASLSNEVVGLASANNVRWTWTQVRSVFNDTPTLVTPLLGTPTSGNLANCTGYPAGGLTGLGAGIATFLATPSSTNFAAAITGETGTGNVVFDTGPTIVNAVLTAPALGTPASGILTNCTAFTLTTTGTSGAATYSGGTLNIPQYSGGGGGMTNPMTTAGDMIIGGASGTPTRLPASTDGKALVLTSGSPAWVTLPGGGDALQSLPLSQFAATTSSQLRGVLSDESGTGAAYFQGGDVGTPSAGVLTNCTGLPLETGVTGALNQLINAQTGTSYTVQASDKGKWVTFSNASPVAVTLPQAVGSFTTGWSAVLYNSGAGTVTVTPTTSTINGAASLALTTNQWAAVTSNGTNYVAVLGGPSASSGATTALDNLAAVAINTALIPGTSDGAALGSVTKQWSDLFLAEGGVVNWDNGDVTLTQTGDILAVAGGDLRVATAGVGTNADSVPTLSSTNTLTNKTLGTGCVAFTLTTTGTSGAATYTGGTLNIPQYAGGGGGGDWVSPLASAEISITTTATATISRQHVCSGTTADYTVTLPAASGNAGKSLAIRVSPACTKLITIDGNGSETIDGALTRVMWAEESCLLYCDGSGWFKVSGKTRAMYCSLSRNTDQTGITANTWTSVIFTAQDAGTPQMWDSGNGRVKVVRPSAYRADGLVYVSPCGSPGSFGFSKNSATPPGAAITMTHGGDFQCTTVMLATSCVVNDYITMNIYSPTTTPTVKGGTLPPLCAVMEVPQW